MLELAQVPTQFALQFCFQGPPPCPPLMAQATAGVHAWHRAVSQWAFPVPQEQEDCESGAFPPVHIFKVIQMVVVSYLTEKVETSAAKGSVIRKQWQLHSPRLEVYHLMHIHWESIQNYIIKKMNLCCCLQRFALFYQEMCEYPQARTQIFSFAD